MKVTGLNGREYNLNVSKYNRKRTGSKLHECARDLLKELFPMYLLLEEVPLLGSKDPTSSATKTLVADFLIPELKIIIEVQGRQHKEYVPHFHKTKANFFRARRRDNLKREWCELNEFTLIELDHDDKDWRKTIGENT